MTDPTSLIDADTLKKIEDAGFVLVARSWAEEAKFLARTNLSVAASRRSAFLAPTLSQES